MGFFAKWEGTIDLPPLPERRLQIGRNWIVQRVFNGATARAKIFDSQFPGHDLIVTDLDSPYRELLLRKKGARRVVTPMATVSASVVIDPANPPANLSLTWDALGELATYADTPEKVLQAWTNKFDFRTESEAAGLPGLRTPQIGALHAVSAHFAVGTEFDAATVVLPTGTGKTETMLATLVYRQLPRALVLVPSDALRSQIARKFIALGILAEAEVVSKDVARPRVAIIATGIRNVEEAQQLIEGANVIVALP